MKKIALFLILIFGSVLVLSSCGTTRRLNVDQTLPDQSAIVLFSHGKNFYGNIWYVLSEWNDYNIHEDLYGPKSSWSSLDNVELTVPAGENRFVFSANYSIVGHNSSTTYKITDAAFQYVMEAGKKYEIKGRTKFVGLFEGYEFYIAIYDTTEKSEMLEEWVLAKSKDFR